MSTYSRRIASTIASNTVRVGIALIVALILIAVRSAFGIDWWAAVMSGLIAATFADSVMPEHHDGDRP